jgi:HEAT repeat protein
MPMRADRILRGTLLVALAIGVSSWAPRADAICPSHKSPQKNRPPPPPPPPPTRPPEPQDPPTPPPATKPPPTGGPRERPATTPADALNEGTWEGWWDRNRWDVLPRLRRNRGEEGDGNYAVTLPGSLRPAVDLWIDGLADADDAVQRAAAGALAVAVTTYRHLDTIAALERLVERGDPYARDLAGLALARRGHQAAAPGLRRILKNRTEVHVSRAFAAIGLIALRDEQGLEDVAEAAGDLSEPEVAGTVLLALGETQDLRFLPVIRTAVERRQGSAVRLRRVRADAISALGKLGCRATVPYLAKLLTDREKVVSRSAALALGAFPDADAMRALREVGLVSEDEFTRGFSAISLGRLGDASALPSLGPRVADDDEKPAVRGFALLSLGLLKSPVGAPLLRTTLTEDPRTALYGAAALSAGLTHASVYRDLLVPAVEDTRCARVPSCGAMALALIGEKPVQGKIRDRAWLDSTMLRPGFAEALAQLDTEAQSAWLVERLKASKRSTERRALIEALAFCGGPMEAAVLLEQWKTAPPGDSSLRSAIVNALVPIVTDRELSFARRTTLHTYYLQDNIVLAHLIALP